MSLNFSKKRYRLKLVTLNNFNPSFKDLIKTELLKSLILFGFICKDFKILIKT